VYNFSVHAKYQHCYVPRSYPNQLTIYTQPGRPAIASEGLTTEGLAQPPRHRE